MDLLRESLNEAKQVGDIYHFTSYENMISIINDDFNLKSFGSNPDNSYISFTRNKNMSSPTIYKDVRITIDGDNLSNKYKIEPFADIQAGFGRHSYYRNHILINKKKRPDESEERVNVFKKNDKIDIKKYIKSIDILDPTMLKENEDEYAADNMEDVPGPSFLSKFYELIDVLKKKSIKYNIVKSYAK